MAPFQNMRHSKREFHFKLRIGPCRIWDSNETTAVANAEVSFSIGFFLLGTFWILRDTLDSMGHFGHGFFCTIPRLEMVQKSSKKSRRRRRRSSAGRYSVFFFIFSQIFGFQPWKMLTIFSNETAASLNVS